MRILALSQSAARRRITRDSFPVPVYTQRQSPGTKLWVLADLEYHAAGKPVKRRRRDELQRSYLDRNEVASALGLAPITVTTLSSPLVPDPAVSLGGIQLWLRDDVVRARKPVG
jgi:hypothetical protein